MDPDEPIEVYTTKDKNQAEVIRIALAGEGINAQLTGIGQAGLAGVGMMEVAIMVRASDHDRARKFIQDHLEHE